MIDKDELISILNKKQMKKQKREEKIENIKNWLKSTLVYRNYDSFRKYREKKSQKRYDRKTQKFIKKIPKILLRNAKKGIDSFELYIYEYSFFISPFLYDKMASYYVDKRGTDIITFLVSENIKYSLVTRNNGLESYYAIKVFI